MALPLPAPILCSKCGYNIAATTDKQHWRCMRCDYEWIDLGASSQPCAALRNALTEFLDNPDYQVAIGGNPNAVDAMLERARAALAQSQPDGTPEP